MTENPWSVLQSIAEQRILEAQQRGDFDHIAGMGRPLHLEDDSAIPEDLRMAYKVLKNAGCLPPELEERKEIQHIVDLLEHCQDEQAYVRHSHRLRVLIERSRIRHPQRPIALSEDDTYYDRILERFCHNDKRRSHPQKV